MNWVQTANCQQFKVATGGGWGGGGELTNYRISRQYCRYRQLCTGVESLISKLEKKVNVLM